MRTDEAPEATPSTPPTEPTSRLPVVIDLAIALVFAIASWVTRIDGLPHNGLWHDDAWPAVGAIHGHPWELLWVGSGHPGFTGVLMFVSRLSSNSNLLAWPTFAAGVLGAPLLFLALRRFGYTRPIAALCGAALVVSRIDIMYSGRVKPYVIDVLIILGFTFVLPRVIRMKWTWGIAAAWVVVACIVAFFTGFAQVAAALAGVMVVIYANDDRIIRIGAVAVQGIVQAVLYLQLQHASDLPLIEAQQEQNYDGHMTLSWNPIKDLDELSRHFNRTVNVYPGGPSWLWTVLTLVVVLGLLSAALRRNRRGETLRAQYLTVLLVFAIIGGFTDKFPFGAGLGNFISRGERSSLWLIPVMAVGLAIVLQRIHGFLPRGAARAGFGVVLGVAAIAVLLSGIGDRARPYPLGGAADSARYIESRLGPGDIVMLPYTGTYPYAVETGSGVTLNKTPSRDIGFWPTFTDPHFKNVRGRDSRAVTSETVQRDARGARRAFVYIAIPNFGPDQATIDEGLNAAGLRKQRTVAMGANQVLVYVRPGVS